MAKDTRTETPAGRERATDSDGHVVGERPTFVPPPTVQREVDLDEALADLRSAGQIVDHLPRITADTAYTPSPGSWEDQVIYFLMVDRFSDGNESEYTDNNDAPVAGPGTPVYNGARDRTQNGGGRGDTWQGGNLVGAQAKLGYLRRLGVTAVWLSPVFAQKPSDQHGYHGYAIQNFLDIDPRFASGATPQARRRVLREFVAEAHRNGIRVILDIVLNHTGDVFAYDANDRHGNDPKWDGGDHPTLGLRADDGRILPFAPVADDQWPRGAVWPAELQSTEAFTRKGRIVNWDYSPEFLDGDFYSLKNLSMGTGDVGSFQPSEALVALTEVYKFWIAYADIDGFRIDTVKHIEHGAARYFSETVHEFAAALGKEGFYMVGEITGSREYAFSTLELTGLDSALGIAEVPGRLEAMMTGDIDPNEYFRLFRNSHLFGRESMHWFGRNVVTMYNDHDMVGRLQDRLCQKYQCEQDRKRIALLALALNVTTMGVPCIYYGSEQCFDGGGNDHELRRNMFGGAFQPFGAAGAHFFDENFWVYAKLKELLRLRDGTIALRRGRQYLRELSCHGGAFGLPTGFGGQLCGIIAWSRVHDVEEVLVAVNTDLRETRQARVTVDSGINREDSPFLCEFDNLFPSIDDLDEAKKRAVRPELDAATGRRYLDIALEPGQLTVWASRGVAKVAKPLTRGTVTLKQSRHAKQSASARRTMF